jgi:hypothetical protein
MDGIAGPIEKATPDGYIIEFLDITSQQEILTNLIYTFIIVALITLIFIFFISKFFANKSISPVKEAFDKQKQLLRMLPTSSKRLSQL